MKSAQTAFAVLDILGYGALMRREPDEVFLVVKELLQSSDRNWQIQGDLDRFSHFSHGATAPTIEYLQFSDTLLIWIRAKQSAPSLLQMPGNLVRSVCYAASLTLASFIAAGIPLRGAVGFGPTFVSSNPLFFTGSELYETMKLERQQVWAGAALHESAVRTLTLEQVEPFFLDYPVPMSEPVSSRPNLAVDWVTCLSMSHALTPPWDQMFSLRDEDVRRKEQETRKFYEAVRALRRSFPTYLPDEPVLGIRERIGRVLSTP